jgi:hypothetical protein
MRNSSKAAAKFDDNRAEQLKQALQDGIDRLTSGDDWKRYLEFAARFPRYSFGNMMLVFAQCPTASLVMPRGEHKDGTKGGWAALGRTIVPGREESGKIFIWKPYAGKVEDATKPDGFRTFTKFWAVPVYDVADTEGDPIPAAGVALLEGEDAAGLLKRVLEFITSNGWTYEFTADVLGGANGDCNPTARHIRIVSEGRSEKQQAKTALHESAHMLLHSGGKGISAPRSQKEVEAESVAFIVSAHLGVDTGDYSFGYVAGWAGDTGFSARTAIKHSGKRIQQAAAKILKFIEPDSAADADEEESE